MERRKFLIGVGSTAVGTSALVGSGAFSSATVEDRGVEVNVADDANAYLALVETSPYANNAGNQLELDFGSNGNGGHGVNEDSSYTFEEVFEVQNQGTEPVDISIDDGTNDAISISLTDSSGVVAGGAATATVDIDAGGADSLSDTFTVSATSADG